MHILRLLAASLFERGIGLGVPRKAPTSDLLNIPHTREYFYVGGQYVNIGVRLYTPNPPQPPLTHSYKLGQIYVEKLSPLHPTTKPALIFIHGAAQTGTNWLNTPDNRPGWSHYFLSKGYTVYLSDQPERGRSSWYPGPGTGAMLPLWVSQIESYFTATAEHSLWPNAYLHTQWPGTGKKGDPIFDNFYAGQVQFQIESRRSEELNTLAYTALIDKIGADVYVVTHSQSGPYGWQIGDKRPNKVRGIVTMEPAGPAFFDTPPAPPTGSVRDFGITELPIQYTPSAGENGTRLETIVVKARNVNSTNCVMQREPVKRLENLRRIPVLMLTGEASYHMAYDYCTAGFMRQAGVKVEHVELGDVGVHGNGHMMFMEKNNLDIAERVHDWLEKH
ncbi:Alpha/Beta hydrolase protein [Clohesyomyces aquaticus]|uniref:Alpha/Beta hydrolase protein n=1 Tax=Clohesyomyces aquaticus TaxID=1231657 RepID=A0A1Y2A4M8_9PLEO|nr:Alpha/Beta hydrolase protein [Clohesyomyces aquaticus]